MSIKADFSKATGVPGNNLDEFIIRGIAVGEVVLDVLWKYDPETCLLSPSKIDIVPPAEQDEEEDENGLPTPPTWPDILPDNDDNENVSPTPIPTPDPESEPDDEDVIPDPKIIGKITTISSGHKKNYDMPAGRFRYFKFTGSVSDSKHPIQVVNTSQSNQKHTVHALVKKGSRPTIADFKRTWNMTQSQSGAGGLYWKYNTGTQAELVEVKDPTSSTTFYIMLYNFGAKYVSNQRLTLAILS